MKIRINPSPEVHQEVNSVLPDRADLERFWGEIDRYNIKTMPDGNQWVLNALTGDVIRRSDAKFFQDSKKNILWIPSDHELSLLDRPQLHKWKNPEK